MQFSLRRKKNRKYSSDRQVYTFNAFVSNHLQTSLDDFLKSTFNKRDGLLVGCQLNYFNLIIS